MSGPSTVVLTRVCDGSCVCVCVCCAYVRTWCLITWKTLGLTKRCHSTHTCGRGRPGYSDYVRVHCALALATTSSSSTSAAAAAAAANGAAERRRYTDTHTHTPKKPKHSIYVTFNAHAHKWERLCGAQHFARSGVRCRLGGSVIGIFGISYKYYSRTANGSADHIDV